MTIANHKHILYEYGIKPNKRLGQNFLIDNSVLAKIVAAADLSPNDIVLEVGPGLGVLTLALAQRVKKVFAVEKDKKMAEILKNVLVDKNVENVKVVEGDVLKIDTPICHPELVSGSPKMPKQVRHDNLCYKIVANIPYYLTSPLIRKFLETDNQPQSMVLMVQKEVAQRICSKPPKMTLLSVATQFYAKPEIVSYVSKNSFWPKPKVDSAIIKMMPYGHHPELASGSRVKSLEFLKQASPERNQKIQNYKITSFRDHFFKVVKASFSQPRKQLINNLSRGLDLTREKTEEILKSASISPTARPGELSVEKYMKLTWILCGKKGII